MIWFALMDQLPYYQRNKARFNLGEAGAATFVYGVVLKAMTFVCLPSFSLVFADS